MNKRLCKDDLCRKDVYNELVSRTSRDLEISERDVTRLLETKAPNERDINDNHTNCYGETLMLARNRAKEAGDVLEILKSINHESLKLVLFRCVEYGEMGEKSLETKLIGWVHVLADHSVYLGSLGIPGIMWIGTRAPETLPPVNTFTWGGRVLAHIS
jgi:hypothetical protein